MNSIQESYSIGNEMYKLITKLFPICRSITGDGVRQSLRILAERIPIEIKEIPTGTKVFDWSVPKEWNIREAYIEDRNGNRIIDFKNSNLHVVGYSVPVDKWIKIEELQNHLYSLPDQPDAIPYVTSYYQERWGFCVSHNERLKLTDDEYHVRIDSDLKNGFLTYAECILPGDSKKEVFISTYICHPSMANNELSGPVVATFIIKWLLSLESRKYTYRFIFIPETIGSITYLCSKYKHLKENVLAGFNISCMGDDKDYSFISSRYEDTLADKVALNILCTIYKNYTKYSFLERGSDERQYCSPGIDLPLVTLCRSKFGTFSEYHTSLDNLDYVTETGLQGGYEYLKNCLYVIENNGRYRVKCLGEPQLGRRGLYPSISMKNSTDIIKHMMDLIAYSDGKNDLIDLSNMLKTPVNDLIPIVNKLLKANLLEVMDI